ncbi:MAG: hypothetical protein M3Q98_06185 [Actinomycetota bacterium]|nr:hypothetical protein [Actinomycetota bacterium]
MRVSRLDHCADDAGSAQLVKSFASWGLTASPSRLSRWEYGHSRGTARLLRAYETGCSLPPFLLFALNDRQRRAADNRFSDVASVEATGLLEAEDIYEILDRGLAEARVSGSDWYKLASFAASHKYFYLSRHNTGVLARRLIEELARSLGPAYILRFEALHLLASQSRMHEALVEQLMEMFEDTSTGAVGDAVGLILRASPNARTALVGRLSNTDSPMGRQGRAWIADIVRDRKPTTGKAPSSTAVTDLSETVCRTLPKWATAHIETDMTLPLFKQALGGRSRLKRHEASLVLMLAGLQATLSVSLLDAFEDESDPVLRRRLANLLEYQVPASQPDRLEALALAESDPESRRSLWASRGHVLDRLCVSEEVADALTDPASQFGVSYALGISGSIDDTLLDRDDLPADLRGVFGWWQDRGPALLS